MSTAKSGASRSSTPSTGSPNWSKPPAPASSAHPAPTPHRKPVAAADPDVLLFAWCGAGDRVPLARVIAQRNWHHLRAVRNRRVHCIPDEFLNTPAPTLLEGLACIAAATHPQLNPPHPKLIQLA